MKKNYIFYFKVFEKAFLFLILIVFVFSGSIATALDDISKSDMRKNALLYDRIVCSVEESQRSETEISSETSSSNEKLDLESIANDHSLHSAVVRQLNGVTIAEKASNQSPDSVASIIKLIIADSFLASKPNLKQRITITDEHLYGGSAPQGTAWDPKKGQSFTLEQVLTNALEKSSNTQANVLIEKAGGLDSITKKANELGYGSTKISSYFNYEGKGEPRRSTAADLSKAMDKIFSSSGNGYKVAQNALKNSSYTFGLDSVANKWGGTSNFTGNVGLFSVGGKKYIISTFMEEKWQDALKEYPATEGAQPSPSVNRLKKATEKIISELKNNGGGLGISNISELSRTDKIGQLMFVGATNDKQEMINIIKKYRIGGVMLTNESTSLYSKEAIDDLKAASGGSLIIASDEEGGGVQRVGRIIKDGGYPSAKELGRESNEEIEEIANDYGKKLFEMGITVNYAPVADLDDGSNDVISDEGRAFSADPEKVAEKAGAFAKGMKAAGVTPVFKHFPGHGHADGDSHLEVVKTPSLSVLEKNDLIPYKTLLKENRVGVMMGHLVVPGLTENSAYKQTSINKNAYDLLRDDYSFDGIVFTDEIANMAAIARSYSPDEAVALAIRAGSDMPLFNFNSSKFGSIDEQVKKTIDRVERYVTDNKIKKSDIDASIKRITAIKSEAPKNEVAKSLDGCRCGGSGTGGVTGPDSVAAAFNYFQDQGLTDFQSAGIVGNLYAESGVNPRNLQDPAGEGDQPTDGQGFGIAQWTFTHRQKPLVDTAKKRGVLPSNLLLQLDYLWMELNGTKPANNYSAVLRDLKKSKTIEEATLIILRDFEAPAVLNLSERVERAIDVIEGKIKGVPIDSALIGDSAGSTAGSGGCAAQQETEGDGESKGNFIWPIADKKYGSQGSPGMCWKGPRSGGRLHGGLDIGALGNANLSALAADGGTVESAGSVSGFGNNVVINHGNGLWSQYSHLASMSVKKDAKVSQGQKIGIVGNTGGNYPIHLHFQIEKTPGVTESRAELTENPMNYLPKDGRPTGYCIKGEAGYTNI